MNRSGDKPNAVERITCAQLTPSTAVTIPVHNLAPLTLVVTDQAETDSVVGAAARQAGVAECSWSGWDSSFGAWITALPDAADAYSAHAVDAGAVVGTVSPDSRIACLSSSCHVDLLVDGTWIELWITPGPIGFTGPVQSPKQELVKIVEPIAAAVRDHFGSQTVGAAWSYDERVLAAADVCDPQTAADAWGAASTPVPRQDGGGASGAVPDLAFCVVGESVHLSALTAGGWSWDGPSNTGNDVTVAGASQARVACDDTCGGRLVVDGTRIDLWTADTTEAAWTAQAEALVAALLD